MTIEDSVGLEGAEALYRMLATADLLVLRQAFMLDLKHLPSAENRAFCQGRIDAITRELTRRSS